MSWSHRNPNWVTPARAAVTSIGRGGRDKHDGAVFERDGGVVGRPGAQSLAARPPRGRPRLARRRRRARPAAAPPVLAPRRFRGGVRPRSAGRCRSRAHDELAWALGGARDATAEVAEALDEQGLDGVAPLLHEWRGALFRVRLARLRLAAPKPASRARPDAGASGVGARPPAASPSCWRSLGALAFAIGAVLALWPSGPPGCRRDARRSSPTGPRTRPRQRAAAGCARARAARCSRTARARPSSR